VTLRTEVTAAELATSEPHQHHETVQTTSQYFGLKLTYGAIYQCFRDLYKYFTDS